ncbi:hypothetical protein EMCRGX_G003910 [Ephydatia muelleri]
MAEQEGTPQEGTPFTEEQQLWLANFLAKASKSAETSSTQNGSTLSAPESVEIPLFTPSNGGLSTSVGASTAAAGATILRQPPAGEYTSSPSAGLPARLSRRIVELEFVEMSELLPDSWQEETQPLVVFDAQLNPRRLSRKAPVQDISLWIECFSRMAAVLVTRYPDKGPELWAYQASIVRAARNYEGLAWVAYDRQLYNEAFTGRAKAIPRCRHCLSDSHTTAHCILDATLGTPTQVHPNAGSSSSEICRSYNAGRCQYVRCRYRHVCQECSYPHPWIQCPKNSSRGTRSAENAFTVEEGNGSPLALRIRYRYMSDMLALESCFSMVTPGRSPGSIIGGTTPLRFSAWYTALRAHPDRSFVSYICTGLQIGFRIGFARHKPLRNAASNMLSAMQHPEQIDEYLEKELRLGRMLGPFRDLGGLPLVHISRFGVIPKGHNTGKWRLITDLSFPPGNSVNDGIDPAICSLRYTTVEDVASVAAQLGPHTLMAKIDIESAYRLIPVHPEDRFLLGVNWRDQVYIDPMLPFRPPLGTKNF